MFTYLIGVLSAFAEPVCHAWANILDNYLSNKLFDRLTPLIFISAILGLVVLPVIWIVDSPSIISWSSILILFTISLLEVFYLYLYYWALRDADTSVVASLFSLGTIFVPLLAFLLIGERLMPSQYLGFFTITLSSVLLALDVKKMKLNRAFVLVLLVSIMLAFQSVLLKYLYEQGVGWGTSIIWMIIFKLLIAGVLILRPKNLVELKSILPKLRSVGSLFVGMEALSWAGSLGSTYALYLIPVSIEKGIASTQPIFVLIYALIFTKIWPNIFHEYLTKGSVAKKVLLFLLTIVGILLVVGV